MNSISFPKLFNTTSTKVVKDYAATLQDMKLLLLSECGELFGDPFFGVRLKRYAFNQNNSILAQTLIEEIYTQLLVFAPQLIITRKDIKLEHKGNRVIVNIKALNKVDYTTDMYSVVLLQGDER